MPEMGPGSSPPKPRGATQVSQCRRTPMRWSAGRLVSAESLCILYRTPGLASFTVTSNYRPLSDGTVAWAYPESLTRGGNGCLTRDVAGLPILLGVTRRRHYHNGPTRPDG